MTIRALKIHFILFLFILAPLAPVRSSSAATSKGWSCWQLLSIHPLGQVFDPSVRAAIAQDKPSKQLTLSEFEIRRFTQDGYGVVESPWGYSILTPEAAAAWQRVYDNLLEGQITEDNAASYIVAIATGKMNWPDWLHPSIGAALRFSYFNFKKLGTTNTNIPSQDWLRKQEVLNYNASQLAQLIYWDQDEDGNIYPPRAIWLLKYLMHLSLIENLQLNIEPTRENMLLDRLFGLWGATQPVNRALPVESRWTLALDPNLAFLFDTLKAYLPVFRIESGEINNMTFLSDGIFINDPDQLDFRLPLFQSQITAFAWPESTAIDLRVSVLFEPRTSAASLRLELFNPINLRSYELWMEPQYQKVVSFVESRLKLFNEQFPKDEIGEEEALTFYLGQFENPTHAGLKIELSSRNLKLQMLFAQFLVSQFYLESR